MRTDTYVLNVITLTDHTLPAHSSGWDGLEGTALARTSTLSSLPSNSHSLPVWSLSCRSVVLVFHCTSICMFINSHQFVKSLLKKLRVFLSAVFFFFPIWLELRASLLDAASAIFNGTAAFRYRPLLGLARTSNLSGYAQKCAPNEHRVCTEGVLLISPYTCKSAVEHTWD